MTTKIIGNQIDSSTVALMTSLTLSNNFRLPALATANLPASPNAGQLIFDTDKDNVVVWRLKTGPNKNTPAWATVGAGGPSIGTLSIVRTNGPTISENITVGPTANGGAEYTNGFSAGPITIGNGYTLTIETNATYTIIGSGDYDGSDPYYDTMERATVYTELNVPGTLNFGESREMVATKDNPAGTVNYDWKVSNLWYGINPTAGNWTANITNVPTTDMFAMGLTIVTLQAAGTGLPTSLQINGSGVTIRWAGNSTPSASSSGKYDVTTFSFIRLSGGWIATGSSSSFG
jgi:hypothetical protein